MSLPRDSQQRVLNEFGKGRLDDWRLVRRLVDVVGAIAPAPDRPLPQALKSEAALEGAYRFLNNQRVSFDAIFEEHAARTRERALNADTVIVIHDTTACPFKHADPAEVGFLTSGKPGFYFHTALVVTADEFSRPLGIANGDFIVREKPTRGLERYGFNRGHVDEEREFLRWERGVDASAALLADVNNVIHVMDSEGDSYSLFAPMATKGRRFVVRSCHNRRARGSLDDEWTHLDELAARGTVKSQRIVKLSKRVSILEHGRPERGRRRQPRKERVAKLEISATTVTLRGPRPAYNNIVQELDVNVVRVFEPRPPRGEEAIEWLLLTTEPIASDSDVSRIVDVYRRRWLIEEFFKALKTGCSFTDRQFETLHALENLLAIYLPIAIEILWLRQRARSAPKAPATEVFSSVQLEVLRAMGPRKITKTPTIREAVWALAGLAGHRGSNGEPGWQILAAGYRDLVAFEAGWKAALASRTK